jgi:asparagine synthase (glutamine-hydrolysing)
MDIASMAHGLEVRSPLLDHRLVELAARLPVRMKLRRLTTKWALKRVLRGVVPDQILDRPKSGFGVPLDRWFRQDLLPMTRDLLLDPRATARGWFHRREVERLIDEHAAGRDLHHPRLWALLVLEIWARQTLDQRCPLSAPAGL